VIVMPKLHFSFTPRWYMRTSSLNHSGKQAFYPTTISAPAYDYLLRG
jgi:hypothetical protein